MGRNLTGPHLVAIDIVLADEGVEPSRARLFGEGTCRVPGHVGARGIHGDRIGLVVSGGSELAGPQDVAARVVLADETVVRSRARLSGEGAPKRDPGHVRTGSIHGNPIGPIGSRGSELLGPQEVAACIVLADEGVVRWIRLLAGGATRAPGHVRTGSIHGHPPSQVVTGGSELPAPPERAPRLAP